MRGRLTEAVRAGLQQVAPVGIETWLRGSSSSQAWQTVGRDPGDQQWRGVGDATEPRVSGDRHAEAGTATDLREPSRMSADIPYIFRTLSRCANKFDAKCPILLARPTGGDAKIKKS